ncbi:MAG: 2-oxoacid:acceptor oxidoreductase family protein [Spirochaetota bacterium]
MLVKMIFAGAGGQGVLTMGNILGNAAMLEGLHVTYLPAYGAAVRGGTANCTLSVSDEDIASPVASTPDFVMALNQPSTTMFINRLESGGQMLYNSDLVDNVPLRGDVDLYPVPANMVAREVATERSMNLVMLGAFIRLTGVVKVESITLSLDSMMGKKPQVKERSINAFMEGYNNFPFPADTLAAPV